MPEKIYLKLLSPIERDRVKIGVGRVVVGVLHDDGEISVPLDGYSTLYFDGVGSDDLSKFAQVVSREDYFNEVEELENVPEIPAAPQISQSLPALTFGDDVEDSSDSTLATTAKSGGVGDIRNVALAYKSQGEGFKFEIESRKTTMMQHAEAIKHLAKIKSSQLAEKLNEMQKSIKDIEHALDMINLYLGNGQRVVVVQQGQKSDSSTPITIRQRLIYMDEEVLLLDDDGVDCYSLSKFDNLLLNKNFLNQILPEEKGVVVARVMKHQKTYQDIDPITQLHLNEQNARTYWIVRNGECIWRFWSDLNLGNILFPADVTTVSEHRPGTKEYQREAEVARGEALVFMKAGLLLQGLIDRTNVFAPFPDKQRPQLTNPATWDGKINFLRDAQGLGEGRKSFGEWITEVNSNLEGGERIIISTIADEDASPKYASFDLEDIFTVRKTGNKFSVAARRTDHVYVRDYWGGGEARPAKKKCSIKIRERSKNWINIDVAQIEDIEFYIRSREFRENYNETLPLLARARRIKLKEIEQEQPFVDLIKAQLNALGGGFLSDKAEELIFLWKTYNKNHRPLLGGEKENAEAWQFIIKKANEFLVIQKEPEFPLPQNCVFAYKAKAGSVFTFVPEEHEIHPGFCLKQHWKLVRGKWIERGHENNIIPKKSSKISPECILCIDEEYLKRAIKNGDMPRRKILSTAPRQWDELLNQFAEKAKTDKKFMPLAIVEERNKDLSRQHLLLVTDEVNSYSINLDKNGDYLCPSIYRGSGIRTGIRDDIFNGKPVGFINHDQWSRWEIIHLNDQNVQKAKNEYAKREAASNRKQTFRSWKYTCISSLGNFLTDQWKQVELGLFTKLGGDPSFFEDHLKTVLAPKHNTKPLEEILDFLGEEGLPLRKAANKSWKDLLTLALELNGNTKKDSCGRKIISENTWKTIYPQDWTTPQK